MIRKILLLILIMVFLRYVIVHGLKLIDSYLGKYKNTKKISYIIYTIITITCIIVVIYYYTINFFNIIRL